MQNEKSNKNLAWQVILLMGLVSLCGDIIYEGARSITGPYLFLLGASAGLVSLVAGLGEFLGYIFRLPFGYLADRKGTYWFLTILGYSLIMSIPFLAWTKSWQLAVILVLLERLGKAMRSPSRDAILSYATKEIGRGFGFGIHEALDQIGAVLGPVLVAVVFMLKRSYMYSFSILFVPAIMMLTFLIITKNKVPSPRKLESENASVDDSKKLPSIFWFYNLFIFFAVCGSINFPLLAYHFKVKNVFSDTQIPLLYALAMLMDGLSSVLTGKIYDRTGMKVLFILPLITIFIPVFSFSQIQILAISGIVLLGIVAGIYETAMRAVIADLVSISKRGFGYGVFNTVYGVGLFFASTIMGFLYERSIIFLILFPFF
ncbi:MAG: MFS transporter, partial [Candidatus Omnitrophica bacterium]|nr:MFS transporter [Candidatus Omnitrophota bacterium]